MNIRQARLLCLLLLCACAAPPIPKSTTDVSTAAWEEDWGTFTLGPNDLVHVTVLGRPEYSSPTQGVRISPDGTLSIPSVEPVVVRDLMPAEAARAIEASLASTLRNPSVSVALLELASRRFHVFGAVEEPGPRTFDRPTTALEGLASGGGITSGGRPDRAVVIRPHGEELEVIAFNADTPGRAGLVQLLPGDMIFVPRSGAARFREEATPYLQGLGLTLSQIASIAIAYDRIENGN
jgi:protein involved in polysaccharide export with SLBB domain